MVQAKNAEPTPDAIEAEVLAALERIAGGTKAVKLHGTARTPGVFIGQKPLQVEAAKICIDERLIQEAGTVGKGRSAATGYIITDKGLNYKTQGAQRAIDKKWKEIEKQISTLVEEQNEKNQSEYIDKTKKIVEYKTKFQDELKKKIDEQAQKFDRLVQQVRNTLKKEVFNQAEEALNELVGHQSKEIDSLIEEIKEVQKRLIGTSSQKGQGTSQAKEEFTAEKFAGAFQRAFEQLERQQHRNFISLLDLRKALPQFSRNEFDYGLNELRRARKYSLDSAEGNGVSLTEEEKEAGIVEMGSKLIYCKRI